MAGICQQVQAWSTQPALTELVEMFGGSPPAGDLPTRLALLDEFSKVWDYRGGPGPPPPAGYTVRTRPARSDG
ncbi:dTDP-glucose 4,6-dehydratase [Mycobacterium sp. 012931]|nr:dTDP-glucose 4,6-dehydratase [Mycobacterium sp. 012931]